MRIVGVAAILGLGATLATPGQADQIGNMSGRSLTAGERVLRIDVGPPDWGYFHPGGPHLLNENRGLRIRQFEGPRDQGDETFAWLGAGAAYGIIDDFEVGGLLVPARFAPGDPDFDDMELYGRLRFLRRKFEMGFQLTLQMPLETEFGLGLGLPMLAHAGPRLRIDTGFEFEMVFFDDTLVNLDIPLAFTWDVGRIGFLGFRTGLFVLDMDRLFIPAGIHGGVVVADGKVDIGPWFMWPDFISTDRPDDNTFWLKTFELGVGVNARLPL